MKKRKHVTRFLEIWSRPLFLFCGMHLGVSTPGLFLGVVSAGGRAGCLCVNSGLLDCKSAQAAVRLPSQDESLHKSSPSHGRVPMPFTNFQHTTTASAEESYRVHMAFRAYGSDWAMPVLAFTLTAGCSFKARADTCTVDAPECVCIHWVEF